MQTSVSYFYLVSCGIFHEEGHQEVGTKLGGYTFLSLVLHVEAICTGTLLSGGQPKGRLLVL